MSNNVTVLNAQDAITENGSNAQPKEQPAPITTKQLGELQDRFAIIPLYTNHYEYALNGEFMIDPLTGVPGIKLNNGKVIMVGEEGRLRHHAMQFEQELSYYGMRNAIIKHAKFDDDSHIHLYESGNNLLDDPIYIDDQEKIKKLCISLDLDILSEVEASPKMHMTNIDPDVIVKYSVDLGVRKEYRCKLSELRMTIENLDTISLAINEIILPSDLECILENCLILIHSILVAVVEEPLT